MLNALKLPRSVALLVMVATACTDKTSEPGTPTDPGTNSLVTSVTLSRSPGTLMMGDTLRLSATPMSAGGPVSTVTVSWTSSNPTVASIDASGLLRALAVGSSNITASAGGKSVTATVTVIARTVSGGVTFTVLPADWQMESATTLQFVARSSGLANSNVVWSVNGVQGGSATSGTITSAGLYTAPMVSNELNVQIRGTSAADPTRFVDVPVSVVTPTAAQATMLGNLWEPRVLNLSAADSMRLSVTMSNYPTSVTHVLGVTSLPLTPLRTNTYGLTLSAAQAGLNYRVGDAHNFVGFIDVAKRGAVARFNLFLNVRDPTMAAVTLTQLAADAQLSTHVLNLRYDSLPRRGGPTISEAVIPRFYQLLPDDFDFIAVIAPVSTLGPTRYTEARNNVSGLGLPIFDNGAQRGSAAKLQGYIQYVIDELFDLAAPLALHEIGHRWINHLTHPTLANGAKHWPLSDLAYGMMSFTLDDGWGGPLLYHLTRQPNGDYAVTARERATEYNDLELYLMGLIDQTEVGEHYSFVNQNQLNALREGGVLRGPVTTIRIDDIIARQGLRTPTPTTSQRTFRIATIVVTRGRLLTADEQAFFDHMAARGEARTELPFTSTFERGTTKPFFLATRGKATLSSTVR